MAVQILRPDGTVAQGSWDLVGATVHGALSDDDTATYISRDSAGTVSETDGAVVDVADSSLPAGAKIRALRHRIDVFIDLEPGGSDVRARWHVSGVDGPQESWSTAYTGELVGPWRVERPGGGGWTADDVDVLQARYWLVVQEGTTQVRETYLDVDYNERPVTVVSAPSGIIDDTTAPTVEWSYSDPEGDAHNASHVRIYSEPSGGWTGDEFGGGTLVYDSDVIDGTTLTHQTDHLDNGTTYRAYVRVRQEWAGDGEHWSAWAYSDFSLAVTAPEPPTITAAADSASARVTIDVDEGSGGDPTAPTEWIEVTYSDDGWQTVRGAAELTPPATVYDYEAPANVARSYRAQAFYLHASGGVIGSEPSAAVDVTWTLDAGRWLKHVTDPTRNRMWRVQRGSVGGTVPRRDTIHRPIGRIGAVVRSDTPGRSDDTLTLMAFGSAEIDLAEALGESTDVWLLQSPWDSRYVVVTGVQWTQQATDDVMVEGGHGYRTYALTLTDVDMPEVS